MNQDQDQLRLLSIFHYVVAGLAALFACIPIIHLTLGILAVSGAFPPDDFERPNAVVMPLLVGWLFIVIGALSIVAGWTFAAIVALAGWKLAGRRSYSYCLVVAAIECIFFPFGTVLGVFTILVLLRPTVKTLFEPPVDAAVA